VHKVQKQQTSPYNGQNLTEQSVVCTAAGEWVSQLNSHVVSSLFIGAACGRTFMVQQLLASVEGGSGLSVIKFLCKGPLKKPLLKSS
jgi:hypothetical protein